MEMTGVGNPFQVWSELARGLRDRFVAELGGASMSPFAGELLGSLAALVTRCNGMGARLEQLRQKDPAAFDAFIRALEKS